MIIDGKKLAFEVQTDLRAKIKKLKFVPILSIVIVGDNLASKRYVAKKKLFGEKIGVTVRLFEYLSEVQTPELLNEISRQAADPSIGGIIIQLPLPAHLDTKAVLESVPQVKDVDALGDSPFVLSPVVAAIKIVFDSHQINLSDRKIVVVGKGKLVGRPTALWLTQSGYNVTLVGSDDDDIAVKIKEADVLILGTGQPHLIKPDMVKEGVVIIDAGTSEADSKLKGDADPACAGKSSFFTPVPGGIGPLTVAMLFSNLFDLINRQSEKD